jgi:hypothetical protein
VRGDASTSHTGLRAVIKGDDCSPSRRWRLRCAGGGCTSDASNRPSRNRRFDRRMRLVAVRGPVPSPLGLSLGFRLQAFVLGGDDDGLDQLADLLHGLAEL